MSLKSHVYGHRQEKDKVSSTSTGWFLHHESPCLVLTVATDLQCLPLYITFSHSNHFVERENPPHVANLKQKSSISHLHIKHAFQAMPSTEAVASNLNNVNLDPTSSLSRSSRALRLLRCGY